MQQYFVIVGTFKPARGMDIVGGMYRGYFDAAAPQTGPIPQGQLRHDKLGASVIGKICLMPSRLKFTQVYEEGSGEEIQYDLEFKGGEYVGTYSGPNTPLGYTRCVIIPVSLQFIA
jgi:hypothetical protein